MQVLSKMLNLNDILCSSWEKYYKELPDLMKYKQKDLKYICKKNILHVTGKKSILVERIKNKYERDYNAHIIQKYVRRKIAINYIYFNINNDLSIPEKNTYNTIINMISKTLTKYHAL